MMARMNYGWVLAIGQLIHVIAMTSSAAIGDPNVMNKRSVGVEKRPALSFNQDLQSLADMLEGDRANSRNHLLSLGKRGPALSFNQDLQSIADLLEQDGATNAQSHLMRLGKRVHDDYGLAQPMGDGSFLLDSGMKRSPSLSFNQDLQSLSDMVDQDRMDSAQNHLMRLGKRGRALSFNQDLQSIADMLDQDRSGASHNHLMSLGKRTVSINQDLHSIADMLDSGMDRKKASAQGLLNRLGKRADTRSDMADSAPLLNIRGIAIRNAPNPWYMRAPYAAAQTFGRARRGPTLSMSVPLNALSDMITDQRSQQSHQKLLGIGKK